MGHIRDGCEHELVDAEKEARNPGGTYGRLFKNTFQGEVFEVSDESRASLAEGKRETPEEPLQS